MSDKPLEVRNAIWDDTGGITLELKHPDFGWIPFTAHKDDPEELGRNLYAAGERGDYPVTGEKPEIGGA